MCNIFYGGFPYPSTEAFKKYLLSHYIVPGPRLHVRDSMINKADGVCFVLQLTCQLRRTHNTA